ncbi:uncharacterized protein Z518_01270 [Rhinocladiella mackenziei CBS 650.93]|uniref:Uncharacterized protein n=1 Tax=Rhinocladiella mackenziei CBS 650.93 TaxID=1442369 RepID=A0A0D2IVW9_9EURO|nr:uncharacterized protein Z518_01270 [Rhinocladiella mackenziei CBS 650.93]KIX10189.1 hypothetical protein Z518_01270 [Rhinocladiella mackenziei CBS 650.93]
MHQRSVSTPPLSPSPPRGSLFNNIPPTNGNSLPLIPPPAPFSHVLQPPSPPRTALADSYDLTISPNRPLSPRSSAAVFPNASIIAMNPLTGRPVLPQIPVLPGRLRLSDSDDGQDEGEEREGDEFEHPDHNQEGYSEDESHGPVTRAYRRRRDRNRRHRHDPYAHSPTTEAEHAHARAHVAAMAAAAAEAEADQERRDRERIERTLGEMMARQRARGRSKSTVSTGLPDPRRHRHSHTTDHREGAQRLRRLPTPDGTELEMGVHHHTYVEDEEDEDDYITNGDRDNDSEAERDELMGLINSSLRRHVARADEENWMFGEPSTLVGTRVGRDDAGAYE